MSLLVNIPEPKSEPRPSVIPGVCSVQKDVPLDSACCCRMEWGINNLLAYSCQNLIVIVDPVNVQHLITLEGHKGNVTCVKWFVHSETENKEFRHESAGVLVSGDESGYIIFWDVQKGKKLYMFLEEGNRKIIDLKILNSSILSLAEHSMITLWNLKMKRALWRIELSEKDVFSFDVDPFHQRNIICSGASGWIYNLPDVSETQKPTKIEKKFRLSSNASGKKNSQFLKDLMFSPMKKGQFFLVTANEIAIYDERIEKTLSHQKLQYMKSEFVKIFVYAERPNELFSVHVDGSVIYWKWDSEHQRYLMKKLSPVIRGGKISKEKCGSLFGISFSQVYHNQFAVVDTFGKLWIWKYKTTQKKWVMNGLMESMNGLISSLKVSPDGKSVAVGTENGCVLIYDLVKLCLKLRYSLFSSAVRGIVWYSEEDIIVFSSSHQSNPSSIGSSLLGTAANWVGAGASSSFSTDETSNEILSLNVKHGKAKKFRGKGRAGMKKKRGSSKVGPREGKDDEIILGAKVSYSRKYLILILKEKPIEIWNLQTLQLLKVIKMKNILTIEWCPTPEGKKRKKKRMMMKGPRHSSSPSGSIMSTSSEQFILSRQGGQLNFYYVNENVFKKTVEVDELKQKRFSTYTSISAVARKGAFLVCGDIDGNILVIARDKETKTIATRKGLIRQLLFGPEESVIAVLFGDGSFAIYSLESSKKISSSHQNVNAISIEWVNRFLLCVASETGIIYIYDLSLRTCCSPFLNHSIERPLRTPALLPRNSMMYLKHSLILERYMPPMKDGKFNFIEKRKDMNLLRNCFGEMIPIPQDIEKKDEGKEGTKQELPKKSIDPHFHYQLIPPALFNILVKEEERKEEEKKEEEGEQEESALKEKEMCPSKRMVFICRFFADCIGTRFFSLVQNYFSLFGNQLEEILAQIELDNEKKKLSREQRLKEDQQKYPSPNRKIYHTPNKRVLENEENDPPEQKNDDADDDTQNNNNDESFINIEKEEDVDEGKTEKEKMDTLLKKNSEYVMNCGEEHLKYHHPELKIPLSGSFSVFRTNKTVRNEEVNAVSSYDQTVRESRFQDLFKIVGTQEALIGKKDEAVTLLVETPSSHGDMVSNFLHACVISASNSLEHFKQTVLLVSSNLFSFGSRNSEKTREYIFLGVELLCLIGEGLKACKVLQNFEYWEDASRIAKTILNESDSAIILTRWAQNLERCEEKMKAAEVWLSLGCYYNVVHILHELNFNDMAYIFVKCCNDKKFPLLTNTKSTNILDEGSKEFPEKEEKNKLLESIYEKYKLVLQEFGLSENISSLIMEE